MFQAQTVNATTPRRSLAMVFYLGGLIAFGFLVAVAVFPAIRVPISGSFADVLQKLVIFGSPICMLLLWSGIKIKHAKSRALRISQLDPVTGLPKRASFRPQLSRALSQAGVLLIADIDDFGALTDRYGRATGDRLARAMALRCRELTRRCDLIGRVAGAGFVIYLPGAPTQIGREIQEILGQGLHVQTDDGFIMAGVSVGMVPSGGTRDVEALLDSGKQVISRVKHTRQRQAALDSLKIV
ncbi:diguanylate cyclase domain-containing protein [Loktanella agnita]|uniref:diguanylate cyclase domain-containing protein n=1 Tax=Loktanella agnita TaxID=287097 RepID=UPI0039863ACE